MPKSSDLWSPQMRKWYSDAPKHGVHFMMADKPSTPAPNRKKFNEPGGDDELNASSGGGGQPQGSLLLYQSGNNPILFQAGNYPVLVEF